ncbi:MAG: DUF1972 domain-containing protein [Butyrivibrio sp.]|nr:DUF1972 domain-containing protein [Butyrivibrio sp.]
MTNNLADKVNTKQHVFIIGAKSVGQYGGYETFVDRLIEQHQNETSIKYHVACKANGDGYMDETKLSPISDVVKDSAGNVSEFTYRNAHIFKIPCPNMGAAVAVYYDCAALRYCIDYCKSKSIKEPIFYILTCRIGPFIGHYLRQIRQLGGKYYLNPDGHEWMRAKWSAPVRTYWKYSEKKMVKLADLVICDSVNIEEYIKEQYGHTNTVFIAYGADVESSKISDEDPAFTGWLSKNGLKSGEYYLIVGRFVPENNYETMISEFMKSDSKKDLAIVTNINEKLKKSLEEKYHFENDPRIKFVGTVYEKELLKKIRENAYGYLHGHEVGGTNPSLLEALASTKLNLLLNVGFNSEVAKEAAFYWSKDSGDLKNVLEKADAVTTEERNHYGEMAKQRIISAYSWKGIGDKYLKEFLQTD